MGQARSHVVMLIEDDAATRDALSEALGVYGYESVAAENGEEALKLLRELSEPPCVILLDIMMPVMDGWEFRQVQQTRAEISSIPVVCVTASTSARDRALDVGCVAFLSKPIQVDALIDAIRAYC